MSNAVLVVAFDGADSEIIEQLGLENLRQEEFGSIDNSSGIFKRSTSELFVSFITGTNYEEHGVKGLGQWNNEMIDDFENFSEKYYILRKFSGLRKEFFERFTPFKPTGYTSEDYDQKTLFDKISNSKWFDVPGYKPTFQNGGFMLKKHGINAAERQQNAINEYKQDKLLDYLEEEFDFIMAHFHKIDHFHHWFWEIGEEEKAWEAYREADEYARVVKEKALNSGFDYIIFMSDHGLPTESQHNENAFYSCNRELFGDETPHITDFHDKILEIVGEDSDVEDENSESDYSDEDEKEVKKKLKDLGYI